MHYLRTQNPNEEANKWLIQNAVIFIQKKNNNFFHGIKYLQANVKFIYIVFAKYQMQTGNALIQVEFPVPILSENTKPIMKKKSEKEL